MYESVLELTDIGNTAIQCDKLAGEFEDLCSDAGDYANVSKLQQQFEVRSDPAFSKTITVDILVLKAYCRVFIQY